MLDGKENVPSIAVGDTISTLQGCLLYKHPGKDR